MKQKTKASWPALDPVPLNTAEYNADIYKPPTSYTHTPSTFTTITSLLNKKNKKDPKKTTTTINPMT